MGTNYYIKSKLCEKCGRLDEEYHIGKSSGGWCFSLHVDPNNGINSLEDVKQLWKDKLVYNEYEETISHEEMLSIILERSESKKYNALPSRYQSWKEFHIENNSEPGPNGLLRHRIDMNHCIGHGKGTYDFIVGDFS